MNYYADVILPLPLKGTFTYQLTHDEFKKLEIGYRVAVSFGKRKIYTGIVQELHNKKPEFMRLNQLNLFMITTTYH